MKVILYVVLVFHALFHLLGFLKAYKLAPLAEISVSISKISGIVWLIASCLFVATIALMIFNINAWVYLAFLSIMLSQYLIITTWHDSKYGTIINVILLVFLILSWCKIKFEDKYKVEVHEQLAKVQAGDTAILKDIDLVKLPERVQKYLVYTGALNKPKVHNFRIRFSGNIRKNNDAPWMPFTSEQFNFLPTSVRLFFMKAEMKKLPIAGFHSFKNGTAFMDIRLLSLFTVQYESGQDMGIAETVTFFNDMCCMAPATLIDERIQWTGNNGDSVFAKFINNNIEINATLVFNNKNELVNFISDDRYTITESGSMKKIRWSTPLKNYQVFNGCKLASSAETIYSYPDKDLIYGTFQLKSIEYNVTSN